MLEDELQELLAGMPEGVAIYESDGRVHYLNPVCERMLGMTLAQARGKRLSELVPEGVGNEFHAAFQRVVAGGASETLEHYYQPWDTWFDTRVSRAGARVHVVAREITAEVRRRRRVETLARISEVFTGEDLDFFVATERITTILAGVLAADCSVALVSADGVWLERVASSAGDPATQRPRGSIARWRADIGHPGEALRTRNAVLAGREALAVAARSIDDPALERAVADYAPTSLLVVPLSFGDETVGVLIATRQKDARPLSLDERSLAMSIAPSVGLYVAHARRHAEAVSLRQRLSNLADALPGLVAFVDREERYQYVNATYEQWLRAPRESFLGRTLREVAPGDGYAKIEPFVRQALAGQAVRFQGRFAYPSATRDVDVQYLPIGTPGHVEGVAVLVQDLTTEQRVIALEREQVDAERRDARRLESLLALAGKLGAASGPDEVARVVVDEGVGALEAAMAAMFVLSEDGREILLSRQRGFSRDQVAAFTRIRVEQGGPVADSITSGRAVWITSREEYLERYPLMEPSHRPAGAPPIAFAMMPYRILGRVRGCIAFVFHDERRLTAADRAYLEVLASHTGEALRRAHLLTELRDVSETRQAMIQGSPAAIWLLDEQGIVRAYNPAAERIFGWPLTETLGARLPAAADAEGEFRPHLLEVLAGNVIQGRDTRLRRAGGEWFDAELYAAPVRLSSGQMMCLTIIADVTERKRRERGRQLRADAHETLARSFDRVISIGDFVRLPLRHFADWCAVDLLQDGALERIELRRQEASHGRPAPRRVPHEPERGGASRVIETREAQCLRDLDQTSLRQPALEAEELAEPRELYLRSWISVPLSAGQRVIGALSCGSESRNFDDLDREIISELARHVSIALESARLFEDARRARREAEAASRAKDEFLAILGHELRNPLAPISTALELMQMRQPTALVRERETITRQVEHLSRLVDDLLDVSRITRGQVELRRERVPLSALVARAVESTRALFESRRHRLTVDVPETLVVFADPTRLSQVLTNLLTNAAKYTPARGNIELRGSLCANVAVLSVRDDGVGIDREMLPRIFDIFVQAPQPSARTDGGLGIGLAIVRNLVEAHGGSVEARSAGTGQGTEIIIRMPTESTFAATSEPAPASVPDPVLARRILVVDDNEDGAVLLSELLRLHGHEVETAHDGPTALQLAETFRPELAILDLGLPGMDGYELGRRLRSARPLQLIAVTGYGRVSDHEQTRQAGFAAHLAKPVKIEVLLPLVDRTLRESSPGAGGPPPRERGLPSEPVA